jgi:hypothetical protein
MAMNTRKVPAMNKFWIAGTTALAVALATTAANAQLGPVNDAAFYTYGLKHCVDRSDKRKMSDVMFIISLYMDRGADANKVAELLEKFEAKVADAAVRLATNAQANYCKNSAMPKINAAVAGIYDDPRMVAMADGFYRQVTQDGKL